MDLDIHKANSAAAVLYYRGILKSNVEVKFDAIFTVEPSLTVNISGWE